MSSNETKLSKAEREKQRNKARRQRQRAKQKEAVEGEYVLIPFEMKLKEGEASYAPPTLMYDSIPNLTQEAMEAVIELVFKGDPQMKSVPPIQMERK